jgi:hypothetical protein
MRSYGSIEPSQVPRLQRFSLPTVVRITLASILLVAAIITLSAIAKGPSDPSMLMSTQLQLQPSHEDALIHAQPQLQVYQTGDQLSDVKQTKKSILFTMAEN